MTAKKKPGEFYRVAKQVAGEYPVVEGTRCVQVKIPDDGSFLPVLAGMVALLGNTWSSIGGVQARQDWAQMWQRAYAETDWSGCMNCEELIECLTPLFEAQTANILTLINNQNTFGTSTPGLPLTEEQREENLAGATNPGCNLDILWAQCLAIIDYTNTSIVDTLQKIEAATNVNELAGLADSIPLIGWVLEVFGTELATDTINYFQEAIQETYEAQYTEEVRIELACSLFCLGMFDCAISVDVVYDLFYSRVSAIVPDDPAAMIDFLEMLAGIDFDGTNVVDLMFWFCWGGVKLASFAVGKAVTTENFTWLLNLAVDDASPDWVFQCDCGSDWNYELDSTTNPVWVEIPGDRGEGEIGGNVLSQTSVVSFGQDVTGISGEIIFPSAQTITAVYIKQLAGTGIEGSTVVNTFVAFLDVSDNVIGGGAFPVQNGEWELWASGVVTGVKKIVFEYAFIGTDQTAVWQPFQIYGYGINPFV